MKTIERDNVMLDYTITGKGTTTLVFVHGAFIDKTYWNAQLDYFSTNYQVLCIDLAGHGKSGNHRSDWSIEALGKDVVAVVEALHLSNIILIGHSLGGDVILEVASAIPDKVIGFVGIDNFKNAGTEMPPMIQTIINQALVMMETDFASVSEDFARQSLLTPLTETSISERVMSDYRNFNPKIGLEILKSSFAYYNRERELLQGLKVKLHLINVDYIPTNEELLKKYARSGYEVSKIQGTCHYPMIESTEGFNEILEKIILEVI